MKMIDTALESLDVLFCDDKILGTTGVPYIFVIFHLWVRVKMFYSKIRLNESHFRVPCVPVWYPKLFVRESRISRLSNAMSGTFFKYLDAFVCCCEI